MQLVMRVVEGKGSEELRASVPDLNAVAHLKPARASGVIRLSRLSSIDVRPLQRELSIYIASRQKALKISIEICFFSAPLRAYAKF